MKIVYFINPYKKGLTAVPDFLKKTYIKKKFYLLPDNKFFREIIIFLYTKILRKFLMIFELLFKVKIVWGNPKKFKYIIFDDNSLGVIDRILPTKKYFILTTRTQNIKEIHISTHIILYILKNLFTNKLKINYFCCLIELIQPKKIVTLIDNSFDFHKIYKFFRKSDISFYAIQNAVRHKDYLRNILSMSNYSGNYFCFGNSELNPVKRYSQKEFKPKIRAIGSLKIELAKEYLLKKKKKLKEIYDICFISEAGSEISTSGSLTLAHWKDDQKEATRLLRYTLAFCKKYNKKLLLLGKYDSKKKNKFHDLIKQEEELFYKYNNKVRNFNFQFFNKSNYDNIKNLMQSKVIIGQGSTLLRESFGIKKKVLVCDWGDKKIKKRFKADNFPSGGIINLKSKSYLNFEKRLKKILKMTYKQYLLEINNPKLIYNLNFKTLEFLRKEIKK